MISEEADRCLELLEAAKEDEGVAKEKVRGKFDALQAVEKDLALLESLEKHEEDIRLCAAKAFWVDVAEEQEVLRKLQVCACICLYDWLTGCPPEKARGGSAGGAEGRAGGGGGR